MTFVEEPERERAFLIGLNVRTRGRGAKGQVTAQAAAAREAAAKQPAKAGAAVRSNGKPSIPEFDADESLAELRTQPALSEMRVLQRANRLSITPVDPREWSFITEKLLRR